MKQSKCYFSLQQGLRATFYDNFYALNSLAYEKAYNVLYPHMYTILSDRDRKVQV